MVARRLLKRLFGAQSPSDINDIKAGAPAIRNPHSSADSALANSLEKLDRPAERKKQREIKKKEQLVVIDQAATLIADKRYNAAISLLEAIDHKESPAIRTLLRAYSTAHRFTDFMELYERSPSGLKQNASMIQLRISAAAHLRRYDIVEKALEEALKAHKDLPDKSVFARTFAYTLMLSDTVSVRSAELVSENADELVERYFNQMVVCAHLMRETGKIKDADIIERKLDLCSDETARRGQVLDVYYSQRAFWDGDYKQQMEIISDTLELQSLARLSLIDAQKPMSCSNIIPSKRVDQVLDGPLVSVIMPAFNCASTIRYALNSILSQSYRNVEVIVVDDCSQDGTVAVVNEVASADDRVKLVSLAVNGGAFRARNEGLRAASGEYVTNQDTDDWAHPDKLQAEVATLSQNQNLIGVWVEHLRCSATSGYRPRNGYYRPDASSLMYRREPVINRIGYYDSVRAAGDGEFHLRLERAFGSSSVYLIEKLLSFVDWSPSSLSGGGDFLIDLAGTFSPARSAYRRSFGHWHEASEDLYIPYPLEHRKFETPSQML